MEKFSPFIAKLSQKNQIVIPSKAREFLGLSERSQVALVPKGNVLIMLKKPVSYQKALAGVIDQKLGKKLLEDLDDGRKSW